MQLHISDETSALWAFGLANFINKRSSFVPKIRQSTKKYQNQSEFDEFDLNKDGKLQLEEAKLIFVHQNVESAFKKLDIDNKGYLDQE